MGRGAFIYVILRARHILNFCFRTFLIYSDTDVVGIFVGIKNIGIFVKRIYMYTPPFTITPRIINLIAEISAQIERYSLMMGEDETLMLRKVNRINTIHSSLAIEGNTLSRDEVADIINGKNVIAPVREIQEVRNAIRAYELFPKLDPFAIKDLLKAHSVMMEALVDDAGSFRKKGVGVYAGETAVHIAPQAHMVPGLMRDLFEWLATSEDHLLIRSCVFHYEFEFIHPFSDGNGRTGRLWQSLILGKLSPLFEHLPVENMVHANQDQYYDAIAKSSSLADSGPFIEFMLQEILDALKSHQGAPVNISLTDNESKVLSVIKNKPDASAASIAGDIGFSSRQVERIIASLKQKGVIVRNGSNKTGKWELVIPISVLGR